MALSSLSPQKNFIWVKEVAKRNLEKKFLIVGRAEGFTKLGIDDLQGSNLLFTGYLTDGEIKSLMKDVDPFRSAWEDTERIIAATIETKEDK